MRIICIADIHGAYNRAEEMARREAGADLLLLAGDMTNAGGPADVRALVANLSPHAGRILAVAGNMDPPAIDEALTDDGISLHGRGVRIGDVGLFGVSGGPVSIGTPNELSEDDIALLAEKGHREVADAPVRIFVPHAPPRNTRVDRIRSGKSVGSTAVRSFVEQHQPDVLLCGHIHEARGTDQLGPTRLVNCGPAREGYYAVVVVQARRVETELREL